ncbi:MAG TPA: DUF3616 domain-containing protein [Verrucomicrobiae bacterium]|nr:DUF3616 domain-containing protein [Verrucomicrobiae bacterium]
MMNWRKPILSGFVLLALAGCHRSLGVAAAVTICRGMCDASAVVPLDDELFVVADDEDNILRVYSRTQGGAPLQTLDLSSFLRVDPKSPEADLEAAAPLGDRVYWITSHAQNKNGKDRPSRRRLFATTLTVSNGTAIVKPVGEPGVRLLTDLFSDPRLKLFNLEAAAKRAPKTKNALNIEALCATPEGQLLIGFRNPVPEGKALIVPLLNPAEVVEGKPARFGDPLLLDLGGLGIRSLARVGDRYFLIAGAFDGGGQSHLYEWNGGADAPRRLPRPELANLNPEAIEAVPGDTSRLLVVSDDGTLKIGGKDCKTVADPNLKYFRATTIDL